MSDNNSDEMVTVKKAADVLGVSEDIIRRRVTKKNLPYELKEGPRGKYHTIPLSALDVAIQIKDVSSWSSWPSRLLIMAAWTLEPVGHPDEDAAFSSVDRSITPTATRALR